MEERIQVLELLEAGKINTDEAVRLIEALGNDDVVCCEDDEPDTQDQDEKAEASKGKKGIRRI